MGPSPAAGRHRALYRALLRLYPRSFRDAYAAPMAQLFADRLGDRGSRAWLETVPDLVRTVPPQRMEAVMARLGPGARVVALALVVLAAVVVSTGMGGPAVAIVALAVAGVLVTRRRVFASVPFGERAPLWPALTQAWWAPVAGVLGVAMLLAGVGTVFEAHNLGGRVFGSTLFAAFGAAMLLGLMRRPFDRMTGNSLILLATVPALLFFWVIVPPLAAVLVWVGVLSSGFEAPRVADAQA